MADQTADQTRRPDRTPTRPTPKRRGLRTRWADWRLRRAAVTFDRHASATPQTSHRHVPDRLVDWAHRTTDQALHLAGEYQAEQGRTPRDLVRLIPPITALGTAAVLQVIVVTDVVGTALADRYAAAPGDRTAWYAVAALLGITVASCVEGGAARLMDLYEKHLRARDSVLTLRIGMVAYVAASAGVIHWWAAQRELPTVMSWLLAGMSGSALFLWSRGARWEAREQMRRAGQIDPALPRLPLSAKLMHPVKSLVTLWLISWEPVSTTDQARARYAEWRADRGTRKHRGGKRPQPAKGAQPAPAGPASQPKPAAVPATTAKRPPRPARAKTSGDDAALTQLRQTYPEREPSLSEIQATVGGGRSRAIRLRDLMRGKVAA